MSIVPECVIPDLLGFKSLEGLSLSKLCMEHFFFSLVINDHIYRFGLGGFLVGWFVWVFPKRTREAHLLNLAITGLNGRGGKLTYIFCWSPVIWMEVGECWSHKIFTLLIWEYMCKSDRNSWLRFSNLMHV